MRFFASVCAVLGMFLFASPSKAQSIELFGGYSFVRAPVRFTETVGGCPATVCPATITTPNLNLNGWEAAAAFKVFGPLALAADFGETSGSFHGANTHLQTYLVGPQLRFPGPISPFAHFLVGAAHESIGAGGGTLITGGATQNAFASAIGGGLDLKVLPFISIRAVQFDYLVTRFNSQTQNQPRISAGIVLRF
jgi:hypothetical protein